MPRPITAPSSRPRATASRRPRTAAPSTLGAALQAQGLDSAEGTGTGSSLTPSLTPTGLNSPAAGLAADFAALGLSEPLLKAVAA